VGDGAKSIRPESAEGGRIGLMKVDDFRGRRRIGPVFEEVGECNLGFWKRGDGPEIVGACSDIRTAD
jgi:hypothetical protein